MKILLATADLDEQRWASEAGLVDGFAPSPTMLDGEEREALAELARRSGLPIHVTVAALSAADIYREGRELARLGDAVVLHIPLIEEGIIATRRLTAEGVRVAASLVVNAAQAVLAAKAGATAVSLPVDQLAAFGQRGPEAVLAIRQAFDAGGTECDIYAAHPQTATEFSGCAAAGADGAVVTPAALRALLLHPLTDRGVDDLLRTLVSGSKARTAV
jgi:transaldolase